MRFLILFVFFALGTGLSANGQEAVPDDNLKEKRKERDIYFCDNVLSLIRQGAVCVDEQPDDLTILEKLNNCKNYEMNMTPDMSDENSLETRFFRSLLICPIIPQFCRDIEILNKDSERYKQCIEAHERAFGCLKRIVSSAQDNVCSQLTPAQPSKG